MITNFLFVPLLSLILLLVNWILANHNPYEEKTSVFECGYHSFLGQNRTQFTIVFFIFGLLFLLFDLEILLVFPYAVSSYTNSVYGLTIMMLFFIMLTLGFIFEVGKEALSFDSKSFSFKYFKKIVLNSSLRSNISSLRSNISFPNLKGKPLDCKSFCGLTVFKVTELENSFNELKNSFNEELSNLFVENPNFLAIIILSISTTFIVCLSIFNQIKIKKEKKSIFSRLRENLYFWKSLINSYGLKNLILFFLILFLVMFLISFILSFVFTHYGNINLKNFIGYAFFSMHRFFFNSIYIQINKNYFLKTNLPPLVNITLSRVGLAIFLCILWRFLVVPFILAFIITNFGDIFFISFIENFLDIFEGIIFLLPFLDLKFFSDSITLDGYKSPIKDTFNNKTFYNYNPNGNNNDNSNDNNSNDNNNYNSNGNNNDNSNGNNNDNSNDNNNDNSNDNNNDNSNTNNKKRKLNREEKDRKNKKQREARANRTESEKIKESEKRKAYNEKKKKEKELLAEDQIKEMNEKKHEQQNKYRETRIQKYANRTEDKKNAFNNERKEIYANLDQDQKDADNAKRREKHANRSEDQKNKENEAKREREKKRKANLTKEQLEEQLKIKSDRDHERHQKKKANLTKEQWDEELEKKRDREQLRLSALTAQEKQDNLARRRSLNVRINKSNNNPINPSNNNSNIPNNNN